MLAGRNTLVIGIVCNDADPTGIVSFNVRRDAPLGQEDHVRIVLGPFQDGRSGYVFAVNPSGARYDGVINAERRERERRVGRYLGGGDRAQRDGWSAEIRIPIQTLSFRPDLHEWHFNVERRVQRLQEIDRWASAVTAVPAHADESRRVADRDPGLRAGPRSELAAKHHRRRWHSHARWHLSTGKFRPSLDVTQRLGSNVTASFTSYTDFAETEVDTRQTNLTRFPLFFPEKRTFFLEGVDIFQFGPPVNNDMIPYFSRRIGLVGGKEVPLLAGAKVNGRVASTNFGGIVVTTDSEPGVVAERTTMAVARVKQNLWRESYIGFLATAGDPLGRSGSWLSGVDFTYSTTSFLGNKNFSINAWGVATGREGLRGDTTAYAAKIDYPNDKWDMRVWYRRIGRDFDPSLGFVPRRAMQRWNPAISNRTRFARGPIQDVSHGINPYITLDLDGTVGEPRFAASSRSGDFAAAIACRRIVTFGGDRPLATVPDLARGRLSRRAATRGFAGTWASPPRRSGGSTHRSGWTTGIVL